MGKILAIGAHTDDIEFYAGGTLAKLIKDHEIIYLIATDGRNGSHDGLTMPKTKEIRRKEQEQAAKVVGVKKVVYLNYFDGELENNLFGLKQDLLRIILKEKPQIVFTFDPEKQHTVHEDYHPDHRTLALAVMDIILIDATLPVKGGSFDFCPQIYLFNARRPNKVVSIGKYLKIKIAALTKFKSQEKVLFSQKVFQSFEKFRVYSNRKI